MNNPGPRRSDAMHTDRVGHFLYGPVVRDEQDPMLEFEEYDHDWDEVALVR